MFLARLLVLPLLMCAGHAKADAEAWTWFVAKSTPALWSTETGTAALVQIKGEKIAIELMDSEGVRHKFAGTKRGNTIRVTMETSETDFFDFPLRGKYTRQVLAQEAQGNKVRENIELVGGGVVVGLNRLLPVAAGRTSR